MSNQLKRTISWGRIIRTTPRAAGEDQPEIVEVERTHKTQSIPESIDVIGRELAAIGLEGASGHLEVSISYQQGRVQFTTTRRTINEA